MIDTPLDEALVEEILADPGDDAPRLVLADKLISAGDPRGELIALQCSGDPRHEAKIQALLAEHGARWLSPLGIAPSQATWVRGFVERVALPWVGYKPLHDRLHRELPLREVRIYSLPAPSDLAEMLALRWPARLECLSLYGSSLGALGARSIACAPSLASIRSLDLGLCDIGDAGVEELVASEHLGNLSSISLFGNHLSGRAAAAIASAWPALRRLYLGQNNLGDEGIAALAQPERRLFELDLHRNQIKTAGIERFARSPPRELVSLRLSINEIGGAGLAELARSPAVSRIERIAVSNNRIGADGARELALARPPSLRRLEIGGNPLGAEGAVRIASELRGLSSLQLPRAGLLASDTDALASLLSMPEIAVLSLAGNEIGAGIASACEVACESLRTLELSEISLGDKGTESLARVGALSVLEELSLYNNGIGNRGARALAASPHLAGLAKLGIGGNPMNRHGQGALRERFGERARW